jgi:hypothetical protein
MIAQRPSLVAWTQLQYRACKSASACLAVLRFRRPFSRFVSQSTLNHHRSLLPASTRYAPGQVFERVALDEDDEDRPTEILFTEVSFDAEDDDRASDVSEDVDHDDDDFHPDDENVDPDDDDFHPDDDNFDPDVANVAPDAPLIDHLAANDIEPTQHDVLHGRGRNIYDSPGNTWYRHVVLPFYKPFYDDEHRRNKRQIAIEVIHVVTWSGGRFIKRHARRWALTTHDVTLDKVMGDLRKLKRTDSL